ncbi:MAG: M48 family metalloprotease [Acidobacteriia bacterium]|nr:M48 family metalloprotease [Terriglobia bacterium]
MAPTTDEPLVLVYDRIAHNQRKTMLLITGAAASVVPLIAMVSIAAAVIAALAHRSTLGQWAAGIGTAVAMVCILGLLFWGMASEPTSKLLCLIGARPPAGDEIGAKGLLENLSIGAGLPLPRFYVIDTLSPNACAAGMDPALSAVAVTVGLLKLLDKRELEGVLAHELSHVGNRDTRLNTLVAAIALFLRIPYLLHQRHDDYVSPIPVPWQPMIVLAGIVLLPVRAYLFFIMPAVAALIRSAVSRNREFLADADAALLTRYPEGLMRALAKISGAGSMISGANPSVAHLYFADPSGTGAGPLAEKLLATHPPISERIALLARFEGGVPESIIAAAVQAGEDFSHHSLALPEVRLPAAPQDELSVFMAGDPAGRAVRLVGTTAPVPVYDQRGEKSRVVAHVMTGDLLVVFDDAGRMREVLTYNQTFGYLPGWAKLERIDMLPAEVFDPESRADMLARLTRQDGT